ncbi:MAG: YcxB family protein [Pseudomonadota bacterium]
MFWFNHPRQVGSRKPVAVLVQRDTTAPVTLDVVLAPPVQTNFVPAQKMAPDADGTLNFSVRYALPEYVSFMWQHGRYIIRRRRMGRLATYAMLAVSTSVAALHFVTQRRARRTYDFTFDEHGIVRACKGGVSLVKWVDVKAIRTYSRGFMVMLKQGTLPIPYRCLSREQAAVMAGFASSLHTPAGSAD